MKKILVNKIKCKKCNEIIESIHTHDFKFCSCGACAVDGGKDYLRRCGNREDWEELSEYENPVEENDSIPNQETAYIGSVPGMTESILASRQEGVSKCATYDPDEEW